MSFNDFKNNTQILKKYLVKMNIITESDIKPQWIEEGFLKQNNPHIFLQILHYVLIKFSPSVLFAKILDFYPTIKEDNDKKFLTNTLTLARKMFEVDVKIDIDQFLSSKFVQKKTQFTSSFCKSAYELHIKLTKQRVINKNFSHANKKENQNQLSNQFPVRIPNKHVTNEDSDDEVPRDLNLVPSSTKRPVINKNNTESSSEDEDLQELLKKKKQLNKFKDKNVQQSISKPHQINQCKIENILPKNFGKDQHEENQLSKIEENRIEIQKTLGKYQQFQTFKPSHFQSKASKSNAKIINSPSSYIPEKNESHLEFDPSEYVTREQFMEIVTGMTKNFTELLTKFNEFQSHVTGWVQNVNAKISILEQNVKTIKNNI